MAKDSAPKSRLAEYVAWRDFVNWDKSYYLAPSEMTGVEAYTVILEATREKKRVGICKLVLNMRERICRP